MDWTTLALATTSGLARGLYPIFLKTVCGTAFSGFPVAHWLPVHATHYYLSHYLSAPLKLHVAE